jgi:hypothetical protein
VNDDGVRITEKLWTLPPAGLEAAAVPSTGRPGRLAVQRGRRPPARSTPRVVTDVLDAFLQPPPEPTQPVARKALPAPAAPSAAPAPAMRPEGLGPFTAWSTEAVLPVADWRSRGLGSGQ